MCFHLWKLFGTFSSSSNLSKILGLNNWIIIGAYLQAASLNSTTHFASVLCTIRLKSLLFFVNLEINTKHICFLMYKIKTCNVNTSSKSIILKFPHVFWVLAKLQRYSVLSSFFEFGNFKCKLLKKIRMWQLEYVRSTGSLYAKNVQQKRLNNVFSS